MSKKIFTEYLACPNCFGDLESKSKHKLICSSCNKSYDIINESIPNLLINTPQDTTLSMDKWNSLHISNKYQNEIQEKFENNFFSGLKRQMFEYIQNTPGKVFCEIGTGEGYGAESFVKDGWFYVGIDFSLEALKTIEKRFRQRNIKNYQLILSDIETLPLRNSTIDLIFGGGVIEHIKNTQVVINHLYRVLKKDGVAFNSVPYLNIGNIIYRSKWGSIPNLPILRPLAEYINIKMLKSKHMVFGYELQFTRKQLHTIHRNAGFKKDRIFVKKHEITPDIHLVKNPVLKKLALFLCNNIDQLWPALEVIAIK